MSILWRSWLAFTVVIAVVLGVLATLAVLQHNAILSDLIRQRLTVVAQTTAASFRSVVDLGLPLSMMRNADRVLAHGLEIDPTITAIHVFNPSGIVVYSSDAEKPGSVSREVLRAQQLAEGRAWSVETADDLDSGYTVTNRGGQKVGGVVVIYPKGDFDTLRRDMAVRTAILAGGLLVVFSAIAFLILRLRLAGAINGLNRLQHLLKSLREGTKPGGGRTPGGHDAKAAKLGFLRQEIEDLEAKFAQANESYDRATAELEALGGQASEPSAAGTLQEPGGSLAVESVPETSLARLVARQLTPWAAALILTAALVLGALTLRAVNRSIEPELASRTGLIGTIVSANVQRAVSAGVPLQELVGAERYFGALLSELPEVAYIAVATGRIILEAGSRVDPYLAPPRARKDVLTHPIVYGGEEIGYIIIDIDPAFIANEFQDVFLDLGVVALVTIMLAYEVLVVLMSTSLTGAFNRLHHLVDLQAAGDFSMRIAARGRNVIDRLGALLSERAERLHLMFAAAYVAAKGASAGGADGGLAALQERYGLSRARPRLLSFAYLSDIRLPLFLFALADELPLSFFPLFTRAADNPWPWLDLGVVISLPLAGYLLAILFASPFARPLARRFGSRSLLIAAMVPTLFAQLGLFNATNVAEIVLFRTLAGAGFGIVTLACQDYVLDVVPRDQRNRSLGIFSAVWFAGTFCGVALGGILADRLGQSWVFVVCAGLVLAALLLVLQLVSRREREGSDAGQGDGVPLAPRFPNIWRPLGNLRFAALVLGIAIPMNVVLQAFISYLVALYMNQLGASASEIGRTLMLYFLAIAFASPGVARLTDRRIEPAIVAAAGAAVGGLALFLPLLWPTQVSVVLTVLLVGVAHGMIRGPQVSVAMAIAENDLARLGPDAVLGALRTLERGGSILGLLLVALSVAVLGYPGAIAAVGIWCLGGVGLYILVMVMGRSASQLREGDVT